MARAPPRSGRASAVPGQADAAPARSWVAPRRLAPAAVRRPRSRRPRRAEWRRGRSPEAGGPTAPRAASTKGRVGTQSGAPERLRRLEFQLTRRQAKVADGALVQQCDVAP